MSEDTKSGVNFPKASEILARVQERRNAIVAADTRKLAAAVLEAITSMVEEGCLKKTLKFITYDECYVEVIRQLESAGWRAERSGFEMTISLVEE